MKRVFELVGLSLAILYSCSEQNKNKEVTTNVEAAKKVEVPKSAPVKFNPKQSDWSEERLMGKVKSIKDSTYDALDRPEGLEKAGLKVAHRFNYDKNGFKTEHHSVFINNPYGTKDNYKYSYKYDDIGDKIERDEYNADISDDIIAGKEIYNYDDSGNVIEKSEMRIATLIKKDYYKYNDKGKEIEHSRYTADGRLSFKNKFKYDDKGRAIEKDDEMGKEIYKYDDNGNVIEGRYYGTDLRLVTKYTYKYEFDKTGNWVQQITIEQQPWMNSKSIEIMAREIEYYP